MLGDEVESSLCRFDPHLSVVLVGNIRPGLLERRADSFAQITPANGDDLADRWLRNPPSDRLGILIIVFRNLPVAIHRRLGRIRGDPDGDVEMERHFDPVDRQFPMRCVRLLGLPADGRV